MKAHKVKAENPNNGRPCVAFAGSQTEARQARQKMVDVLGIKKTSVTTNEVDIPTGKDGLLKFINDLAVELVK